MTIERRGGGVRFLVDGSVVVLDEEPVLPAGSEWGGWRIEGRRPQSVISGEQWDLQLWVDWVAQSE